MYGLIGYLIAGFIAVTTVCIAHMIIAYRKGYESWKFWADDGNIDMMRFIMDDDLIQNYEHPIWEAFMGMMLWPYKVIWMLQELFPTMYELYDKKF